MTDESLFDAEASGTRGQLLQAAFSVLQRDGYEGLSMEMIAEEAGIQKGSIYYHYSGKDELLFSFFELIISHVDEKMSITGTSTPIEQLRAAVDQAVLPDSARGKYTEDSGMSEEMVGAYVQTRALASHRPEYHEKVTELDVKIKQHFLSLIQAASEQGYMQDVDSDQLAETLITLISGTLQRQATSDEVDHTAIREGIQAHINQFVQADYRHKPALDGEQLPD